MQDIIKGDAGVIEGLSALCNGDAAVRHTSDHYGNGYHWFRLDTPHQLTAAANVLKKAQARLTMISAYNPKGDGTQEQALCYHFEAAGVLYNLTVTLNGEWPIVPSITPVFANADWHEREMMELYGIKVTDHPNPKRLFLDEKLDAGLLKTALPLSVVMNGASTKDLWEKILNDKEQPA